MEQVVLLDISSVDLVSWAIRTSKFETRTTLQKNMCGITHWKDTKISTKTSLVLKKRDLKGYSHRFVDVL